MSIQQNFNNLTLRIMTAIAMLGGLVPLLLWGSPRAFAMVMLLVAAAAAWEWARLHRVDPNDLQSLTQNKFKQNKSNLNKSYAASEYQPLMHAGALILLGLIWLLLHDRQLLPDVVSLVIYLLATSFWAVFAPLWMRQKHDLRVFHKLPLFLLFAGWLALIEARQQGVGFLLSLMGLVWLADIGAYAVGRTLGKHKLAPSISPGKTREGALGGVVCVLLVCGFLAWENLPVGNFYALWSGRFGIPLLALALIVLVMFSILGDLFESLLKRQAGVKDSSQLLPGHGGILDRIDALLPTMPLMMLLYRML